eukprot:c21032_g1_i1 orf=1-351(-)
MDMARLIKSAISRMLSFCKTMFIDSTIAPFKTHCQLADAKSRVSIMTTPRIWVPNFQQNLQEVPVKALSVLKVVPQLATHSHTPHAIEEQFNLQAFQSHSYSSSMCAYVPSPAARLV